MKSQIRFSTIAAMLGTVPLVVLVAAKLSGLWYGVSWTWQSAHRVLQMETLNNPVVAPGLVKVIPTGAGLATRQHGDVFLGTSFLPKLAYSTLRIDMLVYVSTEDVNEAVIAVFGNWQESPLHVTARPVSNNQRERISVSFALPITSTSPHAFEFRVGPARPGMLTLNGPANAAERVESKVTISEIGG